MGGGQSGQSSQQIPGFFSPVTAFLLDAFGGNVQANQGVLQPTAWGGTPAALGMQNLVPDLMTNIPMTGAEGGWQGAQNMAYQGLLGGQKALGMGIDVLPDLLNTDPTKAIAVARQNFEQQTVPMLAEQYGIPQNDSDFAANFLREGQNLETNIGGLREANLGRIASTMAMLPEYAQAYGTNPMGVQSSIFDMGNAARDFQRSQTAGGDTFRTLGMLQSLTGPSLANAGRSSGNQKSGGFWG